MIVVVVAVMAVLCILQEPGAPPGKPVLAPAPAQNPDPRLDQPVSLWFRAKPVEEVLEAITKQTQVEMRPDDWVADLRVSVFVRDLPLHSLQSALSGLLHLSWKQVEQMDRNALPVYLLHQSGADAAEEKRFQDMEERAFRQAFQDSIRALALAPEQQQRLIGDRFQLADTLRSDVGRNAIRVLAGLSAVEQQAFLDGNALDYAVGDIAPELQSAVQGLASRVRFDPRRISLHRSTTDSQGFYVTLIGDGRTNTTRISLSSSMDIYREYYAGTAAARTEDPTPARIEKPLTASTFDELLEKLAQTLQVDIMAETYQAGGSVPLPPLQPGETTRADVFNRTILASQLWWKCEGVYLFQRKFWFLERQAEVPERVVSWLRKEKKKHGNLLVTGALTLEDWETLGRLRPQQWETKENAEDREPDKR